MGEVFLATDTRLERKVAIKVLPDSFARDKERLARFAREAQVLASLNHPNIAAIYGLEESGDTRALVLELVEGETLAQRLQRGALPLDEALEVAFQIAQALEAAHEKGIIHRDLKPANVKFTADGKIKVLDFGLAKLVQEHATQAAQSVPEDSPTITDNYTAPGTILGTAAYMSPEQAKGKPLDKRTDIWSFGCVLYECLTGKRAFDGESATDCIGAVLHKEPHWSVLPQNTPIEVQLLLRQCLAKDRNKRIHDIADARLQLENTFSGRSAELLRPSPTKQTGKSLALAIAAVLGVILGIGGTIAVLRKPAPVATTTPLPRKFVLRLPGANPDNRFRHFAISPDGSRLSYVSNQRLYIRNLSEFETSAREVPNIYGAMLPFWSPDSQSLGFAIGKKLYRVRTTDFQAQPIAEADERFGDAGGGAWLQDDTIVFGSGSPTNGLLRVSANGGVRSVFVPLDSNAESDFHEPRSLADGKTVLFIVHHATNGAPGKFNSIAVSSGGTKTIIYTHAGGAELRTAVYSRTGHILFGTRETTASIWALPFSDSELRAIGPPVLLYAEASFPSVANDGTMVFLRWEQREIRRLSRFDRQGKRLSSFGTAQYHEPMPVWSPNMERALTRVSSPENAKVSELWVNDATNSYQLTFLNQRIFGTPSWSPDGSSIAFATTIGDADPKPHLHVGPLTGTAWRDVTEGVRGKFTGDAKSLVYLWYQTHPLVAPYEIRHIPFPLGTNSPLTLLRSESALFLALSLSPDDRFLAYMSVENGTSEIYVTRFPSGIGKWRIASTDQAFWPAWRTAGGRDYLYFTDFDASIYEVPIETMSDGIIPGSPRKLFDRAAFGQRNTQSWPPGFDVSADGQEFLFTELAEGTPREVFLNVVENLSTELSAKKK